MKELEDSGLLGAVRELIEQSRRNVALAVNEEITLLHYRVGKQINEVILKESRADYGKKVLKELSSKLVSEYGPGWGEKHLRHCVKFELTFPDYSIVSTLRRQLSWTHFKTLMYIEAPLKRDFYIEMCKIERWSSRQLQERIQSMLYERTAISKKPEDVIINDLQLLKSEQKLNPDLVFKDPYFLDFLGLKDAYSEKDLEASIIVELQRFIIEMGSDFAFMARQKRITIDHRDYFIDLLFYHRRLKCLVVVDLKMGEFEAGFKGQMELYLRFLEKYEKIEGENDPIGLILCSGKSTEHIELMQLGQSNIRVADYLTALPSQQILQEKLHKAVEIARHKMEQRDFSNTKTGPLSD
ncbi:putative nuclease of restriction endonuclease-like (RecB) superfamily [Dyadobacter sp. BE34]|uniref:Nuclease of restriction endonuclease-like (RecB) superfamily n=1 Tax=Dyadobacter fermentans TaxID=94254 RepID=A0ABU1R3L3_9BACT|nr:MULTISPECIES: PDDEXK nuclease domain-containing protein [Dyadobacter]MDR6808001.1 putative nuclease of restriction endonuclease-like (RecB) superfamily [Dyadobacter fermentans]MDR7046183.1 putative nuclease of restriction endonuclease-like (RecB) superfamily [Dyadobacter sp. BE242]MDR7200496.1 putative nuclease of restriction endonuclease-like (RecB) superfamily [Dyadobacter sp. BE34]MDR7218456.1 putative nuclease of restriction endonuclease-like (RecB) superfamily [Dyadobacter sp. BE31]MDR